MAVPLFAQQPLKRDANYRPEGRAFVCVNGNNRFTRALYGGPTAYRIETSDRPLFAIYRKTDNKNIRFRLRLGKLEFQLDSVDYCKAGYEAGRRDYLLRDKRWGQGELRLSVLAFHDREGGIWKMTATGFPSAVEIEGLVCETSVSKFRRFGDIGTIEKPGGFEAPLSPQHLERTSRQLGNGKTLYAVIEGGTMTMGSGKAWKSRYDEAEKSRELLASSVTIDTPDPYFNPIGGTMVMAADGAWDGKVWQHGAVGWRVPLPGWRGAYMGDFLGMPDRQRTHFDAYAKSQVTDVPVSKPHLMDEEHNLARGAYEWGTPLYSNGFICRNPERNDQFHHYDMNLIYIDELLWHFSFDADTAYMRKMWPVIKSHLKWEKQTWDPDNDGLYDAYCCIWASDALQYNSGAVTHSSAYNYRGNLLAARIAERIGEDPIPYKREAENILRAMNQALWQPEGHWVEYKDFMGLKRSHPSAALWSVYTPIDCGACTPEQAYRATRYVDANIPHIPFRYEGQDYATVSTSNWAPYEWSLNNVAMAEVMHTVLAYYKAGRAEAAFRLLKSNVLDFMYLGSSPGNFGQLSKLDHNTGEAYRDFADVTGISSRALIEGLYGITPDALNGRCVIRPGFPAEWDNASIHTPYLDYSFKREDGKEIYTIRQRFAHPLQIVIRQNMGDGKYKDTTFTDEEEQRIVLSSTGYREPSPLPVTPEPAVEGTAFADVKTDLCSVVNIDSVFNSNVTDIFKNKYLSPRSPYTTLSLPTQGIGDWCDTKRTANIDDSGLRAKATGDVFTAVGVPFRTPVEGRNIAYTSLWDNYPDSLSVALSGYGSHIYLMMAGSTNTMQSRFDNGVVSVVYEDGSRESLPLRNPSNWCPIEQDYDDDGLAFRLPHPRPYRVGLLTGKVSRTLAIDLGTERKGNMADIPGGKAPALKIEGGAAQLLDIPLDPGKKLSKLVVRTTANDVVIGLMSVTLQRK